MSISFGIEVLNHYLCFIFQKKKARTHHLPLMSARAYSTWFSIPKHLDLRQKFETDLYVRPVPVRRWKIMTLGSENHLPCVYPTKCSAATPKQTAEARWKQWERKQTNRSIRGFWNRWPSLCTNANKRDPQLAIWMHPQMGTYKKSILLLLWLHFFIFLIYFKAGRACMAGWWGQEGVIVARGVHTCICMWGGYSHALCHHEALLLSHEKE